jgi:hypothetical protein
LKDGALDSLTGGALACSTLFCMFFGIAPCCKYSSRNSWSLSAAFFDTRKRGSI